MTDHGWCPHCGVPMPPGASAEGLCPACLLKLALGVGERPSAAGDRVGPYRILDTLGEGGMGIVYLAEQEEPIRRRVALKVIKVGMDTRAVVARFDLECQTLALVNHPHIAHVLDAGASADGRPYFVMEYVPGVPITDFCDRHQLSTQARLELMTLVCAAVQHAHQRGIIHRDLKPSNVLVMLQDGQPVPKVIDFGVAKAINQDVMMQTLFTGQGVMIGTPEYMSPEQAQGAAIDTRTDIYSLGVLLYELLAGALPFEVTTLRRASFDEMRRIIREVEPARPSTRISTLGAAASDVATCRQTQPGALQKQLRGDLDWITLKALEKDPARRYASASELAADLVRHIRDEPVAAGPPGRAYRIEKFVRKHRGPVAAGAAIVVLLVTGAVVSTLLFLRAEIARRETEQQRVQANEARGEADRQRLVAQSQAEVAVAARSEAERQRDVAERQSYASHILAADLSRQAGEIREAKRHLEMCVTRLRGWEWRHLKVATDASITTLDARTVQSAADPKLAVSKFDGVDSSDDSNAAFELGTIARNVPALSKFTRGDGRRSQPSAGPLHLDASTTVVAVSADKRRLLATRWVAYGTRFERSADNVDWVALNNGLSDEDRNALAVIDTRSGDTLARLVVPHVGRRRVAGVGSSAPQPTRRPIDPLGVVRIALPARGSGSAALETVSYPAIVRGTLNDDGSMAAVWSWDNVIHLFDVTSGRLLASLGGHTDFIARAVFTSDSARLVSASYDGTVRIWDVASGRTVEVMAEPRRVPFTALATGPAASSSLIAAGSEDGTIRVFHDPKEPPRVLTGHTARVNAIALTRDGRRLVSASKDRTLRVWNTQSAVALFELQGHEDEVTGVRISRDERLIASSSSDHTIRLWNIRAPATNLQLSGPSSSGVAFVDGGSKLVAGDALSVQVWDLLTGSIARQTPIAAPIASMAASENGRRLAVGLHHGLDRKPLEQVAGLLVDVSTLRTWATLPDPLVRAGSVRRAGSIAVSADGARIVTGSNDDAVRLWDSASGRELARWTASGRDVAPRPGDSRGYPFYSPPVAMLPDGSLIAASLTHRDISLWRLRGGRWMTEPPLTTSAHWVTALALTADGGHIVSADLDGVVTIWDVRSGKPIADLRGHDASADAIALSPDGTRIATGGVDRTVRIWDANAHELLLTLRVNTPVQSLAFSPDGERLAAGLVNGVIRVWYSRASPH